MSKVFTRIDTILTSYRALNQCLLSNDARLSLSIQQNIFIGTILALNKKCHQSFTKDGFNNTNVEKAKLVVRRGRKAAGLQEEDSRVATMQMEALS